MIHSENVPLVDCKAQACFCECLLTFYDSVMIFPGLILTSKFFLTAAASQAMQTSCFRGFAIPFPEEKDSLFSALGWDLAPDCWDVVPTNHRWGDPVPAVVPQSVIQSCHS